MRESQCFLVAVGFLPEPSDFSPAADDLERQFLEPGQVGQHHVADEPPAHGRFADDTDTQAVAAQAKERLLSELEEA